MIRIVYAVSTRRRAFFLDLCCCDFERDTSNPPHIPKWHYLPVLLSNITISALETNVPEGRVANLHNLFLLLSLQMNELSIQLRQLPV